MTGHPFQDDLQKLGDHYSRLLREHGDSARGVQWSDSETQERRMRVLAEVGDLAAAKILDLGCGTGHLLFFLQRNLIFRGEYIGYDVSGPMIHAARCKFPEVRFEQRDVLGEGVPEDFDYVLMNGVFNNRVNDNWGLMTALLRCIFSHTRRAVAFNALSRYVDYFASGLFYANPEDVFRFCKEELSPSVSLRHDYVLKPSVVPFEFTVYVYKTDVRPRKELKT